MTEPTKAAIERACELMNAQSPKDSDFRWDVLNAKLSDAALAFARHLDQVSESLKACYRLDVDKVKKGPLGQFILPDPEPEDPLDDILEDCLSNADCPEVAKIVRWELERRGYAITPLKDTRNDR